MNHNTNLVCLRWLQNKIKQQGNTWEEFENFANEFPFIFGLFSELRMMEFIERESEKGSQKWNKILEVLALGHKIKTDIHFQDPEHQRIFNLGL